MRYLFYSVSTSRSTCWLLDNYMKDREAKAKHPKAVFQFQPQIRTVKKET